MECGRHTSLAGYGLTSWFCFSPPLLTDNDFVFRWRHWDFVEVKGAKELLTGRKLWIHAGATEHVQGGIPKGNGHLVATHIDNGDEMGCEGSDDPICKVVTMIVGITKLVLDVLLCDRAACEVRDLIVFALEDWRDVSGLEAFVGFVISFDKVMGMVAADWISKDCVGIIVIENENITHVAVGCNRKATW